MPLPIPAVPLPSVYTLLRGPARRLANAIEIGVWLTRDLSCSTTGHDPFGTVDGAVQCHRCSRRPVTTPRGRLRWVTP